MPSIARVKERTEEQSSAMSVEQQAAIRLVANDLHRLNLSVTKAVDAGVTVELVRAARHHGGDGNWGDLLVPLIVTGRPPAGAGVSMQPCGGVRR